MSSPLSGISATRIARRPSNARWAERLEKVLSMRAKGEGGDGLSLFFCIWLFAWRLQGYERGSARWLPI